MPIENQSLGAAATDADASFAKEPAHTRGGARIRTRMVALQALYQWRLAGTDSGALIAQFAGAGRLARVDRDYFKTLVRGVIANAGALEAAFDAHLNRPAAQLDPVEHAVLLLATFELREQVEIPLAVVISEATNLAKIFGATDGHRFVNGVLDATARSLRGAPAGPR